MDKMKVLRTGAFILMAVVLCWGLLNRTSDGVGESRKKSIRIGVSLYRGDDTFITTLRNGLEECGKEYEKATGIKVNLDITDAQGSQNNQNNQVERFISLGCDVLCINIVDRSDASYTIDKAIDADIPVVFFNREPVEEDMKRWERLYYVGADAKEEAVLQGNILVDAYKENPAALDINGDGVVSYVLLEGETSHQDSLIRTEWSIKTLQDGGVPLEKLTGGIANWERSQASALMEQWLDTFPGEIELVIANNDDMALGAVDAVERAQYKETINIVGIDGTPAGMEAVESGKMFGTVHCNSQDYAGAVFDIAAALAEDRDVNQVIELEDGQYYRVSREAVIR